MVNHYKTFFQSVFLLLSISLGLTEFSFAQTLLLNPAGDGGFETGTTFAANGWSNDNGAQVNKWFVGAAPTGYLGTRCAYVSNDVGGATHTYTITTTSTVHFWRDITVPATESNVTIKFKWKDYGETADYIGVSWAPTSYTPVAGINNTGYQLTPTLKGQSAWQTYTYNVNCVAGTTGRLVFTWRNNNATGNQPPAALDSISVVSSGGAAACSAILGTGQVNIASLPYSSTSRSTCGQVNDLTSATSYVCGSSSYYGDEDEVFIFTPTTSGNITATISNASSYYSAIYLYSACPALGSCSGATCIAYDQSYAVGKALCAYVNAGTTYYFLVDGQVAPSCFSYDISITAPAGTTSGTTCSNAISITLPYSATAQTTACSGNDYNNSSLGSCGSAFESGEDKVYSYTSSGAECISITLSNMSSTQGGWQVYSACPGSASGICVGWFGGPGNSEINLPSAGTYYIIIDSWAPPTSFTYDISITSFGSGQANDLPCNATPIALGVLTGGDNSCTSGTSEPSAPACWVAGTLNTVWYTFVAPASGQIHVGFQNGTLTQAQIALYTGSCSSLTYVNNSCKDQSAVGCPGATITGLTSGTTYYLRLDGYSNSIGYYSIVVDDNSGTITPTTGDCLGAVDICGTSYTSPYNSLGCGAIADVSGTCVVANPCTNPNCCNSGCWLSGELNPRYFKLYINTSGTLAWTLSGTGSGFFDFVLWNITTQGCAGIKNNTLAPIRCNWNAVSAGLDGMQSTLPPGGSWGNFEQPLAVTAGETYILGISNWSFVVPAYNIDFSNSTCGIGSSTTATWTGTNGSAWNSTTNWSGCGTPSCGVDAVIVPAANQPVISALASVRDVTINSGATLTINSGITLNVCGNFTNNGTLVLAPSSTVVFNGTGTQTLDGSLTGTNKFGNVVITKTSGTAVLNQNTDIGGSLTTSNATSILNTNNKYIKLGGNFAINSGTTTFTNTTTGTLEFNGSTTQTYNPGGVLTLGSVVMNQSVTSVVNLLDIMTISGTLTLTNGRITTNASEVSVTNSAAASVSAGNTNSYVDGNLRRNCNSTGSYDFPVGQFSSGKGYQRANINFTSATNVTNLLGKFQVYAVLPGALNSTECGVTYSLPTLNNGYWTITATPAMTSGNYTGTLYNTSGTYTNQGGASSWTIMKNNGGGWGLNGTCALSTVNQVIRTGMSSFSDFGTAQSPTVLPIELTSFTGAVVSSGNWLQWTTASELNNAYFTVEKSADAITFSELQKVNGAGTTSETHNYEAYDFNPVKGINYYRLRQTDFNGKYDYSPMIALNNLSGVSIVTAIVPNPTTGDLHIDLNIPVAALLKIEVLDTYGNVLNSSMENTKAGANVINTSLKENPAGIYLLRITCDEVGYQFQSKVVKY